MKNKGKGGAWKRSSRFRLNSWKESVMLFTGNPRYSTMIAAATDELCTSLDIEPFTPEYEEVRRLLESFYERGASTPEALARALTEWTRRTEHSRWV
jgi:hypothetical protein